MECNRAMKTISASATINYQLSTINYQLSTIRAASKRDETVACCFTAFSKTHKKRNKTSHEKSTFKEIED
jgi:hypothetical protein